MTNDPGPPTRLLLVEDSIADANFIRHLFLRHLPERFSVTHVARMNDAERHLAHNPVDIILLDLGLPDATGVEAVRRSHAAAPDVPVVVLTGLEDEALAAQVLQAGAQEHLIKGQIDARGLARAIRYAVERKAAEAQRDVMEEALFIEKERAEVTLKCIGDGVICTDMKGTITFMNRVAEQMTGWGAQAAVGEPFGAVLRIKEAGNGTTVLAPIEMAIHQDQTLHLPPNCVLIGRGGGETPVEDSVAPIHDREGHATGAVIVFRDVSAVQTMALEMAHLAQHDFLTGLPNRMLLSDRITQAVALAERHQRRVAVLFLDVDGFKHINDALGHSVGDKLLQSIAQRLVGCVRRSDTVSRQGGDEFVVLLSGLTQSEDAAITAIKMLTAVAATRSINRHDLRVTASIGLSTYPDDGSDAETLIKNADTAMYQAKARGPDNYRFFESGMNVRAVERQSIEQELRIALERHELTLLYQPKADLRTGAFTGAEALIRWTHPSRGSIPPPQFITIAEECGLILPIGRWVLREACTQAKAWVDAGLHLETISVNISAVECRSDHFFEQVLQTLDETGLDPSRLELELTESVLMKRAPSTESILQALQAKGVQLAVDDFGTGYSSLSYLRRFPIGRLKIDQSFIRQISDASEGTTIVKAVIGMGHSLNLRVVAEGVETPEQLAFLRDHDCDEAQGFYFSHPVPPERLPQLLTAGLAHAAFM